MGDSLQSTRCCQGVFAWMFPSPAKGMRPSYRTNCIARNEMEGGFKRGALKSKPTTFNRKEKLKSGN